MVAPKTTIPSASGSTLAAAANGGRISVLAPATNLSGTTFSSVPATTTIPNGNGWKAPFKKDHVRARVNTLKPLEGASASSRHLLKHVADPLFTFPVMDDISEDLVFKLIPAKWDKPIGEGIRTDATKQLHAVLSRAFLSSTGTRAKCEEDELFEKLGLPSSDTRLRYEYSSVQSRCSPLICFLVP